MNISNVTQKQKEIIELTIVKAIGTDLKELSHYKELSDGSSKPVYKLRENLPYWLRSTQTGKIEDHVYFLNSGNNPDEINAWLKDGRIYIHKDHAK